MRLRDEFTSSVKRILAQRVQYRCSNPGCGANTSGPQANPVKAINLGVAAHITAASPDGPRYDPLLAPKQRAGISNAIWLCQNCAKLVDNDPSQFTVDGLREWKERAEMEARARIGKTASNNSHDAQVIDKWVSLDYIEKAGIDKELKAQGYCLYWSSADKESKRIDLEGWERVVMSQADGSLVWLKVRDHAALGGYLILLKKRR